MRLYKLAIIWLLPALAFAQSSFRINELKVNGEIKEVIPADLDQDGIKELLVIYHNNLNGKDKAYLSVFRADSDTNYQQKNSLTIELPERFILYDFGVLPGEEGQVVIFLSKQSVEYYRYLGSRLEGPITLLNFSHFLLQIPAPDKLVYYNFLYDFNQDGTNEILIFSFGFAKIFYYIDSLWQETSIEIPLDVNYFSITPLRKIFPHSEMEISYYTPNFFTADLEGDKKSELFAISEGPVWIYRQNSEGIYNSQPCFRLNFKPPEYIPRPRERGRLSLQIADLDDDGKADLIFNFLSGSFFNQKGSLKIYLGKERWWANNLKPAKSWNFNSWLIGPFVRDINSDKNNDLIVPTIQIGIVSAAKVMLTNNFPFDWRYYLSTNHTLPNEPTYIEQLNLRIDFNEGRMIGGFPNLFGDFNGDGIDDLIYGKGAQELVVVIKDQFGRRTHKQEIISVPIGLVPSSEDLNGDQKDDIILTYPQDPIRKSEFRVLVNKGAW